MSRRDRGKGTESSQPIGRSTVAMTRL